MQTFGADPQRLAPSGSFRLSQGTSNKEEALRAYYVPIKTLKCQF